MMSSVYVYHHKLMTSSLIRIVCWCHHFMCIPTNCHQMLCTLEFNTLSPVTQHLIRIVCDVISLCTSPQTVIKCCALLSSTHFHHSHSTFDKNCVWCHQFMCITTNCRQMLCTVEFNTLLPVTHSNMAIYKMSYKNGFFLCWWE